MSALCQALYKIPSFVVQSAFTFASLLQLLPCCLCLSPAREPTRGAEKLGASMTPEQTWITAVTTKAINKKDLQVLADNVIKNNSFSNKTEHPLRFNGGY